VVIKRVNGRRLILLLIDSLLILISGVAALFIRFGWDFRLIALFSPAVFITSIIAVVFLIVNGVYRVVWAYMTNREVAIILRSFVFCYIFVFLVDFFTDWVLPRSIGIVMFLGAALLVLSSRVWWSWYVRRESKTPSMGVKKIGIIGAGESGVLIAEEIKKNSRLGKVVLFIDDSNRKIGREILGIRVTGPISRTNELLEEYAIDELILAIPSAKASQIQTILSYVDLHKIKVKVLPSLSEWINQPPSTRLLREISIEDLLGRDPVEIDLKSIKQQFVGKTVMITGAGGSIGSEITRQIARMGVKTLLLLGRGEHSIYQIDQELNRNMPGISKKRIIADITDEQRMEDIFSKEKPDFVFHTAAHKHVPLMEENPSEAFRVNSLGTKLLLDLAIRHEVERFILISSDKAVKPSSIMGVSKRLAEMYLKARLAQHTTNKTNVSIVRFGNVLGSRGSIIPKFQQQIKSGGPVTITHPEMRRFFMTIPEAASLVLQSSAYTRIGNLFVLDMGEMVYIKALVEKMIYLAGYIPDQDIKIVYTGCRPGEKLFEELHLDTEKLQTTPHPKIFLLKESEVLSAQQVEECMRNLFDTFRESEKDKARDIINEFIPDNRLDEGEESDAKRAERISQTLFN
jgi:FlaA1/EpsC-like NDP-sugar epimerase